MTVYLANSTDFTAVAAAIREKTGTTGQLSFPDGMVSAINDINVGINPSGNKDITASTTKQSGIDVTNYATVSINPTPSETKTTTTNGDITPSSGKLLSKVTVNVPTGPAKNSSDLMVGGKTVTVPAGLYSEDASASVASGELDSPTYSVNPSSYPSMTISSQISKSGYLEAGGKSSVVELTGIGNVDGSKMTVTPGTSEQTVVDEAGLKYAYGHIAVAGDADLVAGNIKKDVEIFGVTGTYEGDTTAGALSNPSITVSASGLITATSGVSTAGYLDTSASTSNTKQLTTKSATTITPSTSSQTAVSAGVYTTGAITVAGDSNLVAGNIKSGTKIFGVTGTYTGAAVNYKKLTITVSGDSTADTLIATDATIGAQRSNAALEISLVPNFNVAAANNNVVRAFNSNQERSPAQAPSYGTCVKLTNSGLNESTTLVVNALNGSSIAGGIRVADTTGRIYFRASSTVILKAGTYTLRATW